MSELTIAALQFAPGGDAESDIWDFGKAVELGFLPTDVRTLG
jgi:hypothetical protein